MSIRALATLISPPPRRDRVLSWQDIEQQLGSPLPADYKAYVELFGSGCLDDFLWVFDPETPNRSLNLLARAESDLAALPKLQAEFGSDEITYPLFPEAGGLLPWGASDNGDVLYWLTLGVPDEWSVVVNAARDPRTEHHPCGVVAFLLGVLSRSIAVSIFPDDFPSTTPGFRAAP